MVFLFFLEYQAEKVFVGETEDRSFPHLATGCGSASLAVSQPKRFSDGL
jgi:hypothetical protein